ncbi:MAG TPA: HEAT repeat domain-containing protein [Phototrophicaceae bacterium]|nr:HEAT repeat domain-containing protein [Phototrophicaceae bacterium]
MLNDLHSPDLQMRLNASAHLLDARAVEPLLALVSDMSAPNEARWRAVILLGWLGDAQAVEPLLALLTDASWDVRNSAVWSLGMIGAAAAFDPLARVLHTSKDEQVPYIAALMLIRLDAARAHALLTGALGHSDESVQRIARSALATF